MIDMNQTAPGGRVCCAAVARIHRYRPVCCGRHQGVYL